MIKQILISVLFFTSCSYQALNSRDIASTLVNPADKEAKPSGLPKEFVYKDFVYNKNKKVFYLIGVDQKLYSFNQTTKALKIVKDSPEQLKTIKLIDPKKNKILLISNENTFFFSEVKYNSLTITQEYLPFGRKLPIREIKITSDKIFIHFSKQKPKESVGYRFQNFLYSDLNATHLNPIGFKPQDNTPGEFFSKIGYKEDEVFRLSQEEYMEVLKKHMNERLLFPQSAELLHLDDDKGWIKALYNPYFNHVEYSKDLKKIFFTNKIEQVLGFYSGENFKFVTEKNYSFTKLSLDEKFLAVASVDDTKVAIYDTHQTKLVYTFDVKENIRHVDFLNSGNLQVITEKGFIYEYKAVSGGEFERKLVGNFKQDLARNIKLKLNSKGLVSALDRNGQRITAPDYQYCSHLLR